MRRTSPDYARRIAEHFARYVRTDEAPVLTTALEQVHTASHIYADGPADPSGPDRGERCLSPQ